LLTRKRSQVQTLSRPLLFSLVKDLSAPSGQRSSRAAAAPRPQAAPPPNRVDPPELNATEPPSPNDHAAWSPPPGPGPWPGPTPTTCPGRPAGAGEHLLCPMLPGHPAGTLALDQRPCRPAGARRRRSRNAGQAAAPGYVNPRASQARPTPHHPLPVRTDAGRRPRRPRTTGACRPAASGRGGPPHRATPGSSARTGRRQRRGHQSLSGRTPGCPDAWTPDAWMLDVRSTGWTDIPTADRTRRTGQRPARPASGHLATGDTRWAARSRPGHGAWGRSVTHDGSAVTAPAPRP
jgi:hypothetical protein